MIGKRPQRLVVTTTAGVAALVAACGGAQEGRQAGYPGTASSLSLEAVYGQAQRSLRSGGVYHEKLETTSAWGGRSLVSRMQRWTDATGDRVREESEVWSDSERVPHLALTVNGEVWSGGSSVRSAASCYGATVATSAVLGCVGADAQGPTSVRDTTVDGSRRVVLVTATRSDVGSDAVVDATQTLLLDAETLLPTAAEVEGTLDDGQERPYRSRTTIEASFVQASTLPPGFFDPAAQGWERPDPAASIPPRALIYWLGGSWQPTDGLPALRLASTVPSPGSGQEAILAYGPAADRDAPVMVTIQVTRKANWDPKAQIAGAPCKGVPAVRVLDGSAQLLCPEKDRVLAVVTLSDAVLLVDTARSHNGRVTVASPFGSVPAMQQVLAALRLR